MRITRVELDNIKSYRHASITFQRGTTAIRGRNGAGKSTIVEAIGFALFGTKLSYNLSQFVREGEKSGTVTVSFISALDDREYHAVRRCGTSSAWYIYDPELDNRPAEQTVDVKDFLRKHLRIETEVDIAVLFDDAIGVPQGTFTADFLLTPTNRKKKFDTLLQVEDYRNAFDKLKNTVDYFKDERRALEKRIDDLERETNQLDPWRTQLDSIHLRERALTTRLDAIQREAADVEARRDVLRRQESEVTRLANEAQVAAANASATETRLRDSNARLQESQEAVAIRDAARAGHEAHEVAQARLADARRRAAARDALKQRYAEAAQTLEGGRADLRHTEERLASAVAAERRLAVLAPALSRQLELERARDAAQQDCSRLEEEQRLLARTTRDRIHVEAGIATAEHHIAELEKRRPLADHLEERRQRLTMLQEQRARRTISEKRRTAIQAEMPKLAQQRTKAAPQAAKYEADVKKLLDSRETAARAPEVEALHARLRDETQRLAARLEHHRLSREQSGAGTCPFLREPCLNIRRKGENSLATYFDRLIQQDDEALSPLQAELTAVAAELEHVQKVRIYVERLPEYEERLKQTQELIANLDEQLIRLGAERAEIEAFLAGCPGEPEIVEAQRLFKASDDADKELRELAPRQAELKRLRDSHAALTTDGETQQAHVAALAGAPDALAAAEAALNALGDPRREVAALESTAASRTALEEAVAQLTRAAADLHAALIAVERELAPFATLDAETRDLDTEIARTAPDHTRYLQHEQVAARLSDCQAAATEARRMALVAATHRDTAAAAHEAARARFDPIELTNAIRQAEELGGERGSVTAQLAQAQRERDTLASEIARVELLQDDLRATHAEYATLEDLEKMLQQFRETIKEAGPSIMKALLRQISVEANRIFGEIMGDRSAQLSWEADYEVVLRRDGKERTFAQLSGGEQMSAALAVRLALLRSLTRLDIAFFDEPTQNMDGERRGNLAEQIRRVRGFDQLIVISHDDTFEQGLDSVIHLEKRNDETLLVEEDALVSV
ncbi:MAG TPA: SMC family ATPase [Ktedonobacterales bacterium]|nr:SMC family ATPase [Ktedonobacterales bacterium]